MSRNYDGAMRDSARQAAAQLKPAADKAKPYARSAGHAARRQLLRTRAWAAPQVERSGQVLQETVAPKAAAMLSQAARRIDPAQPRQRRWRMGLGLATVTAAAGAVAAWLRGRSKPAYPAGPAAQTATVPNNLPNGQSTTVGADTHS
ncbi:MAG: hypothetical protein ACR2FU_02025 [Streptosporangiaceae bacterium]